MNPGLLRLTGGTARGAKLFSIPGKDVRPALARMRTSVFEILRPRLEGARVLDLFAGTGCLGLEALSRGAEVAVFHDTDPRCLEAIGRNLKKLRFSGMVAQVDAFGGFATDVPFDIIFVDPPYEYFVARADEMRRLVEGLLARAVAPDGLILVEHRPKEGPGEVAGGRVADERRYGGTIVTFYARA